MGPTMEVTVVASVEERQKSSLMGAKSAITWASWVKTFTSRCPAIISSRKPLTLAASFCCWR